MYKFYLCILYIFFFLNIVCNCFAFDTKDNFFVDLASSEDTTLTNTESIPISSHDFFFDSVNDVGVASFKYIGRSWVVFTSSKIVGDKNLLLSSINKNDKNIASGNLGDSNDEINCVDMSIEDFFILSCNSNIGSIERFPKNKFKINFYSNSRDLSHKDINSQHQRVIDIKAYYKGDDLAVSGAKLQSPIKLTKIDDIKDLYIFPSYNVEFEFPNEMKFLHGDFMSSNLGIVFQPKTNDIVIDFRENDTIFHSKKLSLKSEIIVTYELPEKLFNPQNWFFGFKDDFLETQSLLNRRILSSRGKSNINNDKNKDQIKARMNMVLFLIANNMFKKAESYLDIMKSEQISLYYDNFFNFISGAVYCLNNQFIKAQHSFDMINRASLSINQTRELDLWYNFVSINLSYDSNLKPLIGDLDIIESYGDHAKFFLIPLFGYLSDKDSYNIDSFLVEKLLEKVKDKLTRREKNSILIYYAKLLASNGDNALSIQILSELEKENYDRYASAYAKIMKFYIGNSGEKKLKKISNSIVELRKMQFWWRGKDALEASILELISNSFLNISYYIFSLDYAKQILDYIPEYKNIVRVMNTIESILYIASHDTSLNDLDRVNIFIESSKIIPVNEKSIGYVETYIKSILDLQMHYYAENVIKNILSFNIMDQYKYVFSKYLIQSYFETFRYEDVLEVFNKYNSIYDIGTSNSVADNSNIDILYTVCLSYFKLGKYNESINIAKNFINMDDRFLELYYNLLLKLNSWNEVKTGLENMFVFRGNIKNPLSISEQKLIIMLAYGYFSEKRIDLFKKLYDGYNTLVIDPLLKKEFLSLYKITKDYFNKNDYIKDLDYLLS